MGIKSAIRELVLRVKETGVDATSRKVTTLHSRSDKLKKLWPTVGTAGKAAFGIVAAGTTAATAAVTAFGYSVVRVGSQMESYQIQLSTVLKSEQEAMGLIADIERFASRTPFQLSELIAASSRLEQFKINTFDVLETLGDAAAIQNLSIQQAAEALIDLQAGEFQRMKEFASITRAAIEDEVGRTIKNTPEDLRIAVEATLTILEERFGGGMKKLSASFRGRISNMQDAWFRLRATVAEGGFFDTVEDDLGSLLNTITDFEQRGGFEAISEGLNYTFEVAHEQFVTPLLDDFSDIEFSAQHLALTIEIAGVRIVREFERWSSGAKLVGRSFLNMFDPNIGRRAAEFAKIAAGWLDLHDSMAETNKEIEALQELMLNLDQILGDSQIDLVEALGLDPDDAEIIDRIKRTILRMREIGEEDVAMPRLSDKDFDVDILRERLNLVEDFHEQRAEASINADMIELDSAMATSEMIRQQRIEDAGFYTDLQREMFGNLLGFKTVFVTKGIALDQAAASFGISAAGEYGKAVIDILTRESKLKAAKAVAESLEFLAYGDLRGFAIMTAAAAKYGLVAGAGEIGKAFIDRTTAERIEALNPEAFGVDDRFSGFAGQGAGGRGTASVSRTQQGNVQYNITITNHVAGDYNINEGQLTDAEQIQELIDTGQVVIPRGVA